MEESKKTEIKELFKSNMDLTPKEVEMGYIFNGANDTLSLGSNEHYKRSDILVLKNELLSDEASVISDINNKMSGTFLISAAIPATDEDEDEAVEAVYFVPSTQVALENTLTSVNWNTSEILSGLMNGDTWTQFKNSYN